VVLKQGFAGTQPRPLPSIGALAVAASTLQQHSGVTAIKTIWPSKPKIFTIKSLARKKLKHFTERTNESLGSIPSTIRKKQLTDLVLILWFNV
jgi:hypothetical protein